MPLEIFLPFQEKADDLLKEARIPAYALENGVSLPFGEPGKTVDQRAG